MRILSILKSEFFFLSLIIILGLILRIYKIDAPIADWHSWRQADTAAVSRNFIKEGFDPFRPKFDDMSAISEVPTLNPSRFRFVEFPVYNILVYPFYLLFGVVDKYHRLVSVIVSLGSSIFLYLIVKKYTDKLLAFFSALTFTILPFNVFFSRTTLPEPTFIFFALGMMYFVDRWIWEPNNWRISILGFIFMSVAFLIKPWAIFFYLPLIYSVFKRKFFARFIIFSLLAIGPFILWRLWILQQPEGIPASSWLLNGDGIRFRPAFWWWIVSERMGREILGVSGLALFIFGLILRPRNGNYFLHLWVFSIFLYFVIFSTGNVRHNYYQLLFVPPASVFMAIGFLTLLRGERILIPRFFTIFAGLFLYILAIYFGYKQVVGFYQINNPVIVEAGKVADQILPQNAVVVAPYNGDTAFLYQINRPGWPVVPFQLKDLVTDYGVTHYISTTKDAKTAWVMRHFLVLENTPNYVIADLTKITKSFDKEDPEP